MTDLTTEIDLVVELTNWDWGGMKLFYANQSLFAVSSKGKRREEEEKKCQ